MYCLIAIPSKMYMLFTVHCLYIACDSRIFAISSLSLHGVLAVYSCVQLIHCLCHLQPIHFLFSFCSLPVQFPFTVDALCIQYRSISNLCSLSSHKSDRHQSTTSNQFLFASHFLRSITCAVYVLLVHVIHCVFTVYLRGGYALFCYRVG
jgi:hypothetical protein